MTELFAVIGKPILHSRSPEMHNAGFVALGIDARYVRLAPENAESALQTAREMGIRGMNVTSPFKEVIAKLIMPKLKTPNAEPKTSGVDRVRLLGVNTVLIQKKGIPCGYNTDPDGVTGALKANGVLVKGKSVVVLGAGGAAKAAVFALRVAGAQVTVANRTVEKANEIARTFGCESCSLDEVGNKLENCRVVISALTVTERVIDPKHLHRDLIILDANYSNESVLVRDARSAGCKIIDGREWLLYQGAAAFEIFTRKKAPLLVMRKAVYASVKIHPAKKPSAKRTKGNIALIGFMGSGKNTIAHALAKQCGKSILDMDKEIEKRAGMTIAGIFANPDMGEKEFRRLEREQVAKLDSENPKPETRDPKPETQNPEPRIQNHIINCGGGAILDPKNREILRRNSTVIWLWASPQTIVRRISGDRSRPLLHVPVDEKERVIERLLETRKNQYAECADLVFDTGAANPEQVAKRILYEIDKPRYG